MPLATQGPLIPDSALGTSALALLEWCYAADDYPGLDWTAERLSFVQIHPARVLGNRDLDASRQKLTNGMGDCEDAVKWQWRAFVDGTSGGLSRQRPSSTHTANAVHEVERAVVAGRHLYRRDSQGHLR